MAQHLEPPWPGGAAAAVDQSPTADPRTLDLALRERAAAAIAQRPPGLAEHPWRQTFHVEPPVGLLNDPNGLVQHEGVYHLCYQWHPFAAAHALKFWAHVTSTDLVHWSQPTIALAPSHPYESHGCYSGSGIVHEGQVRFLYTGNVRTPDGGRTPFQLLASLGADGATTKHAANPLVGALPGCTAHVRDPKVWSADGVHWMVLGAQTEDLHGAALLLRSADLLDWEHLGPIAGGAADPLGYMWECPDLLALDGHEVLVISPQLDHGEAAGAGRWEDVSLYAVGSLDLAAPAFRREGDFRRVDAGPDFYAPQTFRAEDGRTVMVGWMGMPDHAGQPVLAEKHPTAAAGWVHCLTVPRELSLVDGALVQQPVAELAALRGEALALPTSPVVPGSPVVLAGAGAALDLELRARCDAGASLTLALRDGPSGRPVRLRIEPHAGRVTLDRTALGTGEGGTSTGAFRAAGEVAVRVLLDHASVEVFLDEGRLAMSARIYPAAGEADLVLTADGGPVQLAGAVWRLAAA